MHKELIEEIQEHNFRLSCSKRETLFELTLTHLPSGESVSWIASSKTGTKKERDTFRRAILARLKESGYFKKLQQAHEDKAWEAALTLSKETDVIKAIRCHIFGESQPSTNAALTLLQAACQDYERKERRRRARQTVTKKRV